MANITRLVFVWQGNEYESPLWAPCRLPAMATPLLREVRDCADQVHYVLPAPDAVWHWGPKYHDFAVLAEELGRQLFEENDDVATSTPIEFMG